MENKAHCKLEEAMGRMQSPIDCKDDKCLHNLASTISFPECDGQPRLQASFLTTQVSFVLLKEGVKRKANMKQERQDWEPRAGEVLGSRGNCLTKHFSITQGPMR